MPVIATISSSTISSPSSPTLTSVSTPSISPSVPTYIEDADRKLTREEAMELKETEKEYNESLAFIKDAISPAMMRIDATKLQIGDTYIRTIFTYAYPDVLEGNWLSPLINWDVKFDISMYVYPVDSARVMKFLRKRLTQLGSQRAMNANK
jgi:conjugal transfer ATP-binding protein TraC